MSSTIPNTRIPFALSAQDTPIPFRPTRKIARDLGTLEQFIVPRGAKPCAPPARSSDPRLAEAV